MTSEAGCDQAISLSPDLLCIQAQAMMPQWNFLNFLATEAAQEPARLAPALIRGQVSEKDLDAVEQRRRMPTVVVQSVQRILHGAVFVPLFAGRRPGPPPALLFAVHAPMVRRLMPRLIAFGPRPEHAPPFARRVQPRSSVAAQVGAPSRIREPLNWKP